jgi:hypothetical protein
MRAIWFKNRVSAYRQRRLGRCHFSMRAFLTAVGLLCVCLGLVSVKWRRAQQQRNVVNEIRQIGGVVEYDYQFTETGLRDLSADLNSQTVRWMPLSVDLWSEVYRVELSRTSVRDTDLAMLQSFRHLKSLELHNTDISDAGLIHVSRCVELTHLDLQATHITDRGLRYVETLHNLRSLWIGVPNSVSDDGLARLRQKLPNCEIYP